ncbi:MAG: 30S ribosomal protein S16 [Rickettsiales bacterium]
MATKIRLSRHGSNKRPFYWLVAADIRAPRDGNYIEKLGTFNPLLPKDHPERIKFKNDRIEHWLKTGAKPTERSEKLMNIAGIKVANSKLADRIAKRKAVVDAKKAEEAKKKAEEEAKAAAEAAEAKKAEEAAAAPQEEAAPAEEAPAEAKAEVKTEAKPEEVQADEGGAPAEAEATEKKEDTKE